MSKHYLEYSEEVSLAQEKKIPIVALESTILSHGLPYPENWETGQALESILREKGVVPATIAIADGKIKVGLSSKEMKDFCQDKNILKVSRRDLPCVVALGKKGATTVSATMICAAMANIRVFVTGGIGGVHRGAEKTMDVSADLAELAKTPVAVICSGAKSILDLEKTLEYLETQGVNVLGYKTDDFPAFYSRESGRQVDYKVETPQEIAAIMQTKWNLGLEGGIVIANPIPLSHALDDKEMEGCIEKAIEEAQTHSVTGKAITPFLLSRLQDFTKGRSISANIALVKNNTALGAEVALAYHKAVNFV